MKHTGLFFLFLLPFIVFSQVEVVSDVEWKMGEDDDGIVDKIIITYNLNKIDRYNYYDIQFIATDDNIELPTETYEGDVEDTVEIGKQKKIVWYAYYDLNTYSKLIDGVLEIEVIATPNEKDADPTQVVEEEKPVQMEQKPPEIPEVIKKKTTPLWIGLGGSVVAGATMIIIGSSKVSDGNDLYDIYETYTDENANVYDDKYRDEYYDEANKKFKTGRALQITGSVILVGGSAFFITKLIKAKEHNKTAFNITPIYNQEVFSMMPAGALATFTFKF